MLKLVVQSLLLSLVISADHRKAEGTGMIDSWCQLHSLVARSLLKLKTV